MFVQRVAVLRAVWAVVLAACCLVLPASGQQPLRTLLVGVDHRPVTSLDGPWHYLVGVAPTYELYDRDGQIRDNSYAQNTHPHLSTEQPHNAEYDFAPAPTLRVPGDWNTQDPALFRFEGVVWYQRDFDYVARPGQRSFLHVGAANYRSVVWVNGKRICEHEGGFTPFDCEATAALHPGSNFVVIAVDSTRHQDDIPSVAYDWFDYGGLTRDVSLVSVPEHFIDDYDVHLKYGPVFAAADATLTGYVHVQDAPEGTPVTLRIPEAGVQTSLRTDKGGHAAFEVKAGKLELWSPEHPKLYRVELRAGVDALTDDIGFRDVRIQGTRILLNGAPVFLQGANAHAEAPLRGGRAVTDEDVRNLFTMLHGIDANFVRLAHYPHDERMERTADREGIMVWSEIPLWQGISFSKPEVYAKAAAMLGEMIRRDRNKASVIFWSVSNETPNNPVRTKFLTDLVAEARRLDATRPIASALLGPHVSGSVAVQDDPLASVLDVIGQNEYLGWYEGRPSEADTTVWHFPDKPVIITEFGAEAKFGHHGSPNERWTEEQQADVYRHQFTMFAKIPQLRGVTPWVLMDFRSPGRNIPGLQDGYNRKGLYSERMERKAAADVLKKAYDAHALGHAE